MTTIISSLAAGTVHPLDSDKNSVQILIENETAGQQQQKAINISSNGTNSLWPDGKQSKKVLIFEL